MGEIRYNPDGIDIENIEIKNGKYLVKFPFLEVPVEVGQTYYRQYFKCSN